MLWKLPTITDRRGFSAFALKNWPNKSQNIVLSLKWSSRSKNWSNSRATFIFKLTVGKLLKQKQCENGQIATLEELPWVWTLIKTESFSVKERTLNSFAHIERNDCKTRPNEANTKYVRIIRPMITFTEVPTQPRMAI